MIKVWKLMQYYILFITAYMLGFFQLLLGDHVAQYDATIKFLISIIAIMVALYIRLQAKERTSFSTIDKYILLYVFSVLVIGIYSYFHYGYSIKELMYVLTPYFYIFYAYPIVYILKYDKNMRFIKYTSILVMTMLLIKSLAWYLYNFHSITIFSSILFEYKNWNRLGVLRVDTGYLFALVFCYYFSRYLNHIKTYVSLAAVIFLSFFVIVITNFRFQIITIIVVAMIMYLYSANQGKKKFNRAILIAFALILFTALGGFEKVISSFAVNGQLGGSTYARILTFDYYSNMWNQNKSIFGLGMLSRANDSVVSLMTAYNKTRWLEDLGIIGGIFTFGIFALLVYGNLYYLYIKRLLCLFKSKKVKEHCFVIGIIVYVLVSCFALNIYDAQRAFNVPFDIAIVSFFCKDTIDNKSILRKAKKI